MAVVSHLQAEAVFPIRSLCALRAGTVMWQAFLGLNIADVALTSYLLKNGGTELNPLFQGDHWWVLKMGLAVLIALALRKKVNIMRGLVVGMSLVVGWNLAMTMFV